MIPSPPYLRARYIRVVGKLNMFLVASRKVDEKILSIVMRSLRLIVLSAALYRTLASVEILATMTLLAAETDEWTIALQCW